MLGSDSVCLFFRSALKHGRRALIVKSNKVLDPPGSSSKKDQFGGENDTVGLGGCYDGWTKAVHAEVRYPPRRNRTARHCW